MDSKDERDVDLTYAQLNDRVENSLWYNTPILENTSFSINITIGNTKKYSNLHINITIHDLLLSITKQLADKFNTDLCYTFDKNISLIFLASESVLTHSNRGVAMILCNKIVSYCTAILCKYIEDTTIELDIDSLLHFNTSINIFSSDKFTCVDYIKFKFIQCQFNRLSSLYRLSGYTDAELQNTPFEKRKGVLKPCYSWDNILPGLKFGYFIKKDLKSAIDYKNKTDYDTHHVFIINIDLLNNEEINDMVCVEHWSDMVNILKRFDAIEY